MGIVGPLERTQACCQYIMVVCDYATSYLYLLKVTARTLAPVLLQLFSMVGIPQ